MADGLSGCGSARCSSDIALRALRYQEDRQTPLAPQDTQTAVQDQILERVEEISDDLVRISVSTQF
jgi:hypothetical protein